MANEMKVGKVVLGDFSETGKGRISKKRAREIAGAAWDSGFDAGWQWGYLAALLLSLALFWLWLRLSNSE